MHIHEKPKRKGKVQDEPIEEEAKRNERNI